MICVCCELLLQFDSLWLEVKWSLSLFYLECSCCRQDNVIFVQNIAVAKIAIQLVSVQMLFDINRYLPSEQFDLLWLRGV